ncbi:heterokaryon incompatibility protein-domain-containing protein [Xylogone sp. PMI_703]|nr:heterokaryon incompatibility protein-domain-containing protein [Xylogone sp. PMI_703]
MVSSNSHPGSPARTANEEFLAELEALMEREFFSQKKRDGHGQEEDIFDVNKSYAYRPLHGEGSIRLLSLLPGKRDDPLKGRLLHASFHNAGAYEALSYTWGPHHKPECIILAEGSLPITESLRTALTHLRREGERRLLWVDAICINQSNNEEKAQQVMLMPKIYSTASCVQAWLGEEDSNGRPALGLLEKIGKTDFSALPQKQISISWMQDHGLPLQGDPLWQQLLLFWQRPWFRRSWVVQEFVLAKDVHMLCGDLQVHWKSIASALEKMTEYMLLDWGLFFAFGPAAEADKNMAFAGATNMRLMLEIKNASSMSRLFANTIRSFTERDESSLQELREGSWSRIPYVQDLVMMLRELPQDVQFTTDAIEGVLESMLGAFGIQAGIQLPLMQLLPMFEYAEATEPRDRLFSLLGMAQDGDDKQYYPDYDESTESVLVRFSKAFVNNGFGIDMLYKAGLSGKDMELPSWVPDWTKNELTKNKPLSIGAQTGLSYAAASDIPTQIRVSSSHEAELVITGRHLDDISRTLQFRFQSVIDITETTGSFAEGMRAFFSEVDDIILNRESYITGEPLSEVLWRTLSGNQGMRPHIAPDEFGDQYSQLRADITNGRSDLYSNLDDANEFMRRILPVNLTYKLCETKDGLVGMMPLDTQVGDSVFVFNGSRMPFVLRRCTDVEGRYQIIGGCYVHGMMKGEILGSDKWKEQDIYVR